MDAGSSGAGPRQRYKNFVNNCLHNYLLTSYRQI